MLKVRPSTHGYVVTSENHTYFAGHVTPTKEGAKHPYKADISLMESKPDETGVNQMTFTRLKRWDAHDRAVISAVTSAICDYIKDNSIEK